MAELTFQALRPRLSMSWICALMGLFYLSFSMTTAMPTLNKTLIVANSTRLQDGHWYSTCADILFQLPKDNPDFDLPMLFVESPAWVEGYILPLDYYNGNCRVSIEANHEFGNDGGWTSWAEIKDELQYLLDEIEANQMSDGAGTVFGKFNLYDPKEEMDDEGLRARIEPVLTQKSNSSIVEISRRLVI